MENAFSRKSQGQDTIYGFNQQALWLVLYQTPTLGGMPDEMHAS